MKSLLAWLRGNLEESSSLHLAPGTAGDPTPPLFQGVTCKELIILAGSSKHILSAQLRHVIFRSWNVKNKPSDYIKQMENL